MQFLKPSHAVFAVGLFALACATSACAGLAWSAPFDLPPLADGRPNPGVARPFFGEHNGVTLLAGGANFPDRPLSEGGRKVYHADIYALPLGTNNVWRRVGALPTPAAEGVSVGTPYGIVCVGGCEGADGARVSSRAFLMTWNAADERVSFSDLPDFPYPVKMAAVAAMGSSVYVAGGWRSHAAESDVWCLDLEAWKKKGTAWRALPPLPMEREQPVAAVLLSASNRQPELFVIGGMAAHEAGPQWALDDGYAFPLFQGNRGVWRRIAAARSGKGPVWPMIGAWAVAIGDQTMLCLGGSHREVWNEQVQKLATLRGASLDAFRSEYFRRPLSAFRFNREAMVYHAATDQWYALGEVPFQSRCGAAVVCRSDGSLLVASGEVGPGIRTPACVVGRFVSETSPSP
jgi:cyclically-permuted mutarotase family protein